MKRACQEYQTDDKVIKYKRTFFPLCNNRISCCHLYGLRGRTAEISSKFVQCRKTRPPAFGDRGLHVLFPSFTYIRIILLLFGCLKMCHHMRFREFGNFNVHLWQKLAVFADCCRCICLFASLFNTLLANTTLAQHV